MTGNQKDYTEAVKGIGDMELPALHELYSGMLATAHDLAYQVPDDQLVETDDVAVLRSVIPPLNKGLMEFRAGLDAQARENAGSKPPRAKKVKGAAASDQKTKTKPEPKPKKPKADAPQPKEDTTMATATAKKAKTAKTAKKVKTAKKAGKAASTNARTPVASKWAGTKIKVLVDENPTRKGTGRYERVAVLLKHDGKTVDEFLKKGKSGTLSYSVDQGWIKIV